MKRSILIRSEVETEIEEQYRWYNTQSEGLGEDFLHCVEESLLIIQNTPEIYPVVHRSVRRALIRRFPHGIYYLVEKEIIVVLAVFHERRNPKGWKSRN